jgi:hypothetical protein
VPHYNFSSVVDAQDAVTLRVAACIKAVLALGGSEKLGATGREQLVTAIVWVARSGYGRADDYTIDPDVLADAAVARFRALADA